MLFDKSKTTMINTTRVYTRTTIAVNREKNKSIILFDAFYILDLSIVFPAMIIIAIINLSNKPSSVILSGIVLVKLVTLMPALLFNDIFHFIKNGHFLDISFDIIATVFTLFSFNLLYLFKRGINI